MTEIENIRQLTPMAATGEESKKPKKYRGTVLMLAVAVLLVAVVVTIVKLIQSAPTASEMARGGQGDAPPGPPPAAVFVAPVEVVEAREEAVVTGALRAVSRARVAAQESEAVSEVFVDVGQHVEAGAIMVRLDGRRIQALFAEATAQLQSAQELVAQRAADLKRARTDLEMNEALLKDKAISQSQFLDAERTLVVTEALENAANQSVHEAKSRIQLLEVRRHDLEIEAPFAGIVTERNVEPGEWVAPGQSVITLVTIDPVEAWLEVPERHLGDLSEDSGGVRIRLSSSGQEFEPSKMTIVPDVEPRSQMFTVVVTLENPDGRLVPGRSIAGVAPVGEREKHWAFPVDALIRAPAGDFVFVAGAVEGSPMPVARKVSVQVHFERGETVFVRTADAKLNQGDPVVVEGNDRLQPGQPLMVKEAEAAAGTPVKM